MGVSFNGRISATLLVALQEKRRSANTISGVASSKRAAEKCLAVVPGTELGLYDDKTPLGNPGKEQARPN